ncbi:hypothetical protein [Neobacillus drentensis]|uniref:hypothetical protein n=1 Tax=Neobacillus drentensis TaxID=220684 RepID=UPI0030017A02
MTILDDISRKDIQLFVPEDINQLLPKSDYHDFFNNEFSMATLNVKKVIEKKFEAENPKSATYINLLYFIQEELMNNKVDPREFLIESALTTLKTVSEINNTNEFNRYEQMLAKMNFYPIV